jgi:hypothetical protein
VQHGALRPPALRAGNRAPTRRSFADRVDYQLIRGLVCQAQSDRLR